MRTLISKGIFALALLPAIHTSAQGTEVSYDFADLRYLSTDLDGLDGDGFLLEGSFSPSGNWLIVGSFTSVALDFDVDSTAFEVGGGYVWPQAQNFDVFATATFISASVDTNFGDADETGFGLTAGVRSRFTDNFEGRGEIKYADVGASDTLIRLSGDYYFTDQFVAGISVDVGGDADTFYVGGRWIFGSRKAK